MQSIAKNYQNVLEAKNQACQAAGRPDSAVQLLAVSKTRAASELESLYQLGQRRFGENYLQEALEKIDALAALDIEWHFIGPIQSNKTRPIAESFSWVHSVDRLKIARRLSEQRPAELGPLNICLQVNISREDNKSGCLPEEVLAIAAELEQLANIQLRGLMAIPKATSNPDEQRVALDAMAELFAKCREVHPQMDTLSMGMTGDLAPAIMAGSTIVRIGTALFGKRDYSK